MKENVSANPEAVITDTKLSNMEGIITKTTRICHQLYSKKLKEELRKVSDHHQQLNEEIARLTGVAAELEAANRKLKEEGK